MVQAAFYCVAHATGLRGGAGEEIPTRRSGGVLALPRKVPCCGHLVVAGEVGFGDRLGEVGVDVVVDGLGGRELGGVEADVL